MLINSTTHSVASLSIIGPWTDDFARNIYIAYDRKSNVGGRESLMLTILQEFVSNTINAQCKHV